MVSDQPERSENGQGEERTDARGSDVQGNVTKDTDCDMPSVQEGLPGPEATLGQVLGSKETTEQMDTSDDTYAAVKLEVIEEEVSEEEEESPADVSLYLSIAKAEMRPKPQPKSVLRKNKMTVQVGSWKKFTKRPCRPTSECKFFHYVVQNEDVRKPVECVFDFGVKRKDYRETIWNKANVKGAIKRESNLGDITEEDDEKARITKADEEADSVLPESFADLIYEHNQVLSVFAKNTTCNSTKVGKDFTFKTFRQYRRNLLSQLNQELPGMVGNSNTDKAAHGKIIDCDTDEDLKVASLTIQFHRKKPKKPCRLQFGQLVFMEITLADDQKFDHVASVVDVVPLVSSAHSSNCEEDSELLGRSSIIDSVTLNCNYLQGLLSWKNCVCSVRLICYIHALRSKAAVAYYMDSENKKHSQIVEPILKSVWNGVLQVEVSEQTKKRFDYHDFYINCIQKAVDTLLVNHASVSIYCAFDDRNDQRLLILAIEIVRQIFKDEKALVDYKDGIVTSSLKKEDPDANEEEAHQQPREKLRLIVTSGNGSNLAAIVGHLHSCGLKIYHVGDESECPSRKEVKKKAAMLLQAATESENQQSNGAVKEEEDTLLVALRTEAAFSLTSGSEAEPTARIEIEKFMQLARMELVRDADVLAGTVDDLLNDSVVNETALCPDNPVIYEGVVVHEANAIDEPSITALTLFTTEKLILLGNSGKNDNCSSLFRRMVRLYEHQLENLTSESRCSVISSYNPIKLHKRRREDVKKEVIEWALNPERTEEPMPLTSSYVPPGERSRPALAQSVRRGNGRPFSTRGRGGREGMSNGTVRATFHEPLRQPQKKGAIPTRARGVVPTRARGWVPPSQRKY